MDFEFDSEGSFHLVWECNMLHPLKSGAAVGGGEDDAYPFPCTLREQVKYEQECLELARACEAEQANERHDAGCPSPPHLDTKGAQAWARRIYDQIQYGKRETPTIPQASQIVAMAAMIMRTIPEPSTDKGR